jgi:hypothetical protein
MDLSELGSTDLQRALEQPFRVREQPEFPVDIADGEEESRLDERLIVQIRGDAIGSLVEDLACRDRVPARLVRIRDLEERHQKVRDLPRRLGLGPGDGLGASGAHHPDRGRDRARDQGDRHHGRCGHAGLVAADELGRAVSGRVVLGDDRLAIQIAFHILRHLLGRRVSALRFLAQRHESDPVHVALQLATQPLRLGVARETDRVGRPLRSVPVRLALSVRDGRCRHGPADRFARSCRFLLRDDSLCFGRRAADQLERPSPGEQLVEHHPQRIHIGGCRDGLGPYLLRARVLGRHESESGASFRSTSLHERRVEDLRDPEVQQLHVALWRDQDVGRLEIPVNHEVAVRMLDGTRHGAEELQPAFDPEPVPIAVHVDRDALDVLHDQVRSAILGHSSIQEGGDVRMVPSFRVRAESSSGRPAA